MGKRLNIYFERKTPRRDSIFRAVKDIGRVGVNNSKEVGAIAIAQFLDWLDGWTKNDKGKRVRFTGRKWAGRMRILRILAKRYGGRRHLNFVQKLKKAVESGRISKRQARMLALKYAKKYKLPIMKYRL